MLCGTKSHFMNSMHETTEFDLQSRPPVARTAEHVRKKVAEARANGHTIGFVPTMRALGGAQAINVEVSAWLVVCTFTLCLFLGFGKRRCELAVIANKEGATKHRATLSYYSLELLTLLMAVSGAMAVITFMLYTLDPSNPTPHTLIFTTPLVFYAIFRYALVIAGGKLTGPTDVLIHDRPFLVSALLWVLLTVSLILFTSQIERYLPKIRFPNARQKTSE